MVSCQRKWLHFKGIFFCQLKCVPVKRNDFLSKEINSCQSKWEVRQMSNVNAGEENEIAIPGGSDIIKCNELEWFRMVCCDERKCATPRITLSQAKYFVSSLSSLEVKSFIPPWIVDSLRDPQKVSWVGQFKLAKWDANHWHNKDNVNWKWCL